MYQSIFFNYLPMGSVYVPGHLSMPLIKIEVKEF